jgi:hypothetical protein
MQKLQMEPTKEGVILMFVEEPLIRSKTGKNKRVRYEKKLFLTHYQKLIVM